MASAFSIHPNPTKDVLTMTMSSDVADWRIELVNTTGQTILSTPMYGHNATLDISTLASGHHHLRLLNEKGELVGEKGFIRH